MGQLSDLVRYYNQLCAMTAIGAKQYADLELQKILQISQDPTLTTLHTDVLGSFDRFEEEFVQVKRRIQDQISIEQQPYLQKSYKDYEEHRGYRYEWFNAPYPSNSVEVQAEQLKLHVEKTLNNRLPGTEDAQDFITNRITRCSSWQTTTMILRPGLESWLPSMVNNDPIYLVDENYDLLTPAMADFNEIYQRRLRTYAIREDLEKDILWQLPDNQFGLVLAWNYFNHRPFEIIRRYLTELNKKMRPGGMLLMTYNDCDRWPGVVAAEYGTALYTPGSLIKSFAESLGFEETFNYHNNGPWTWIELRKPGAWESNRGGQALAKILPKPVA